MKLLPIPLSPLGAPPLGMWNSEFLWRYPPAPPSPLAELKTQLPPQLSTDPRLWGREEVATFVRWTEREFDLPKFELDLFQMNGKAICLLTKSDLAERCPGAGDIIHNVLQLLIRDAQMLHRHLPSSPVTPTGRYPLSPHSHPPTPNWSSLAPPENPFYASHLQQFMASNSVTLSPAPSTDSQAGSPPQSQAEAAQHAYTQNSIGVNGSANNSSEAISSSDTGIGNSSGSSNQSDSDEDNHNKYEHKKLLPPPIHYQHHAMIHHQQQSPPLTPINKDAPSNLLLHHQQQMKMDYKAGNLFFNQNESSSPGGNSNSSQSPSTPTTPGAFMPVKREFFPDTPEPNTNGRLLWDFLQQLLNDPQQRYSNYIAWKCRDTGVFKIVDPAGLAKLWGIQKNHLSMNYDKMSRALRYYYRVNILRKVQGERHCYQFLRNPTELKSIKNISLLRQTMANQQQQQQQAAAASLTNASNSQQQNVANLASLLPQSTNLHHLTAAAAAIVQQQQNAAANNIKLEYKIEHEAEEPTDLSTSSSDRKFMTSREASECYPLIRGSNGLTTIQLLRQHQEQLHLTSPSSSPTSLSPPINHLSLKSHHVDEDMPTDLRKYD